MQGYCKLSCNTCYGGRANGVVVPAKPDFVSLYNITDVGIAMEFVLQDIFNSGILWFDLPTELGAILGVDPSRILVDAFNPAHQDSSDYDVLATNTSNSSQFKVVNVSGTAVRVVLLPDRLNRMALFDAQNVGAVEAKVTSQLPEAEGVELPHVLANSTQTSLYPLLAHMVKFRTSQVKPCNTVWAPLDLNCSNIHSMKAGGVVKPTISSGIIHVPAALASWLLVLALHANSA